MANWTVFQKYDEPFPDEPAVALLRRAWVRLTRSPAWWTEPLSAEPGWSGAWSPHLEWHGWSDLDVAWEGGALIVGADAYLWGPEQLAILGSDRKGERVRKLVGRRWLACPTEIYLPLRGRDWTARQRLRDRTVGDFFLERASFLGWEGPGSVWVRSSPTDRARCRLDVTVPTRPHISGLGDRFTGPLAAVMYGTPQDVRVGHGPVPEPQQRGVLELDELTRLIGEAALHRPLVQVAPPDEDDDDHSWSVRSDRAHDVLNVRTGYGVERKVQRHLRHSNPALLPLITFDSYGEEFLAYASNEPTARALAGALMQLLTDDG